MEEFGKKVYVIGHRNPDTDSVVSAVAYARLKQAMGMTRCVPARAGKATPQTEYIFDRFNTPLPEFLPDLEPKVGYYYRANARTVHRNVALWEALTTLEALESRALPVVDDDGCYHSLLHYSFFAQRLLQLSNPKQKTAVMTSIELLAQVLHAQPLVMHNAKEIRKSPVVVAAAELETFKNVLSQNIPENAIVITGNRGRIQEHAIDAGVRALVVTNGNMIDRKLRERAEKEGVSVLVSSYDTSSSTMLLIYSMPVSSMSNAAVKAVGLKDPVSRVAPQLASAPVKSLPVVDERGMVVGMVSESNLYHEANVEVILVDHNERSQSIEGIENYRILEIIDHHRLGAPATRDPITFINRPVGATCTIVAALYQENRIPLTNETAGLLLCGILADTLVLGSATTTGLDRETAEYLANLTNLDVAALGRDIMNAASNIAGRSAVDLVRQDMKTYRECECAFTVSQIEVGNPADIVQRKGEFLAALEAERTASGGLFASLLVTDITALTSLLLMAADPRFEATVNLPRQEEGVYVLRDVVSRKKQLMPILSELVESFKNGGGGTRLFPRKE
jgi:manganese-dependent inorganic pyrophosphatase